MGDIIVIKRHKINQYVTLISIFLKILLQLVVGQ